MTLKISTLVLLLIVTNVNTDVINISLKNKQPRIIDVPTNNDSVTIRAVGLTPDVAYIQCQAHTQTGNVTLSLQPLIKHDTAVNGRDVGVLLMITETTLPVWYLYSNRTAKVQVLLHLTFFTKEDPLVGGCNEEFNLDNDSNIHLHVHSTKTTVQFQWSNTGVNPKTGAYPNCEDSVFQSELEYHIYVRYMEAGQFSEDEYYSVITKMLTAENVVKHGTLISKISNTNGQTSFVDLASYKHRGVVYNTVVSFHRNGMKTQAAYIPVVSYGCDIADGNTCQQRDVASLVLSTIGGLVGLFVCLFGHRFFKTENFLFGFLIFGLIFYQILALTTYTSYLATLVLATIFGLIGGALLLGLWWYYGIPVINVLFIGLVTGYLFASVLFYTPFGNLTYLKTAFNYGASFACGVLVLPVVLLYFTRLLSIFSCAVVGSFGLVLMFDLYLHSALHAIVLNSLRHGTDKSYIKILVTGPFTTTEIVLTVVWFILLTAGTGFQLFRERKKAPFPPCPRQLHNRARDLRGLLRAHSKDTSPDREPLLRGGNHSQYGTTHVEPPNTMGDSSEVEINRPGMI